MKPEDKELLLKDLCARLPYRVKVKGYSGKTDTLTLGYCDLVSMFYKDEDNWYCKPYLRPMSSMTEEEKKEMKTALSPRGTATFEADGIHTPMTHIGELFPYSFLAKVQDWLLEHHFDFIGLIPMDCAIEVTEENNPYKD